jgi:hypothetical protein
VRASVFLRKHGKFLHPAHIPAHPKIGTVFTGRRPAPPGAAEHQPHGPSLRSAQDSAKHVIS